MTVRDMVGDIQREILRGDVAPARASHLETSLSALLGYISEEMREADLAYSTVLLACLGTEEKANRARIRAECSPEYLRKREAKDVYTVALEMIRSLRQLLRTQGDEMRLQR